MKLYSELTFIQSSEPVVQCVSLVERKPKNKDQTSHPKCTHANSI